MAKFQKGHKLAKGGKRPGAGRPTKAELEAKEAALTVWEKEIKRREEALAKRYVSRAFRSDRVLLDLRKARLPDAKQEIERSGSIAHTVIIQTIDPDDEREKGNTQDKARMKIVNPGAN